MADPPKPSGSERRYPRIPVRTPAEVKITAPGITSTGHLLDTSDDGLAIAVAGGPLPIGEVVTVELLMESPDKLPPLRATVRYSKGIRHGLQFLPEQ